MFRSKPHSFVLAAVAFALISVGAGTRVEAAQEYLVHFRLTKWKAQHIHDVQKAEERYKTLKSLRCEVKKYAHNGHIDVKYRQLKWTAISFQEEEEARKWQRWLRAMGFEVRQVQ